MKYVVRFDDQENNHHFKVPVTMFKIFAFTQKMYTVELMGKFHFICKVDGKPKGSSVRSCGNPDLRKKIIVPEWLRSMKTDTRVCAARPFIGTELICIR